MSGLGQFNAQQDKFSSYEKRDVQPASNDVIKNKLIDGSDVFGGGVEDVSSEIFSGENDYSSFEDSLLSSLQSMGSENDNFSLEPFMCTENPDNSDVSEIYKLRESISVLYSQTLSMKLQLSCVCDELKKHISESMVIQSAVASIEGILQTPSVLPNVIFPETVTAPAPSLVKEPQPSMSAAAPEEVAPEGEDTYQIVDDLEQAVNRNDSLVKALKDLHFLTPTEEEDLRSRLQVLYTNNVILTSIIDSNNVHTFEMSSLLNQKTDEVLSLRDELSATQSALNTLSLQVSQTSFGDGQSRVIPVLTETTDTSKVDMERLMKEREEENDRKLKSLMEVNLVLRQQIRKLRAGETISTVVGDFNSANPNAIAACIQGLVSRLALAEAKVETSERRLRMEKLKDKMPENDLLQRELQSTQRLLKEKDGLLQRYQDKVNKMKRNEDSYKRAVSELRHLLEQRQREMTKMYSHFHK